MSVFLRSLPSLKRPELRVLCSGVEDGLSCHTGTTCGILSESRLKDIVIERMKAYALLWLKDQFAAEAGMLAGVALRHIEDGGFQ